MTPAEIARLPYRPCVGVVLANPAGHVFVGERLDAPGAWQMPQGGIDPGETPREAALRELTEETGLSAESVEVEAETPDWVAYDLPLDLVPRIWGGRYRGQQQRWFLMRYRGSDSAIDIAAGEPEFSRWRWMPAPEVASVIVPFKRDVYVRVLRLFAGHLS